MSEVSPTFTVSMAQYEHMQSRIKELEHLPKALEMANARAERWMRRHDLLVTAHEAALAENERLRNELSDREA